MKDGSRYYSSGLVNTEPKKEKFTDDVTIPTERGSNGPRTDNGKMGVVCNAERVRLRKSASLESGIVEILNKGDKVVIFGEENGFFKVMAKKDYNTGFISSKYCQEV